MTFTFNYQPFQIQFLTNFLSRSLSHLNIISSLIIYSFFNNYISSNIFFIQYHIIIIEKKIFEEWTIARGVHTRPTPAELTKPPNLHPISTRTNASVNWLRVSVPKTRRWQVEWRFSSPKLEPLDLTDVIYKSGQLQQDQA